jgi:hypothetical protein
MIRQKLVFVTLTLALASACRSAGPPPSPGPIRLVHAPPCLTVQPVDPGPILRHAPMCEVDADGEAFCPTLSDEQLFALWEYTLSLEDTAWRAFRCAERQRARYEVSPAPSGDGASQGPAAP